MQELHNLVCNCRPAGTQLLQDIYYGLKSLKDRISPKYSLTPEDDAYITLISEILYYEHRRAKFTTSGIDFFHNNVISVEQIQDWLNSIKHRMKGE